MRPGTRPNKQWFLHFVPIFVLNFVEACRKEEYCVSMCRPFVSVMAVGVLLCGCASPGGPQGRLPPMAQQLPDDLQNETREAPDFRRPTVIDSSGEKSSEEAQAIIDQLEEARQTHGEDTRKTIERR
jgi:hypothetical protein